MIPGEILARVQNSYAATQTDSLTVILDLSDLTPSVARAVGQVMSLPTNPHGSPIPAQAPKEFTHRCRGAFSELAGRDEGDAIEFATAISAFVHECRHVHDLRSTRMGAELLLHDLQVYSGVGNLLGRLREWQASHPNRSIPLPLSGELDIFTGEFEDIAEKVRASLLIRDQVWAWWNTKSQTPIIPGYSLQDLFEFVAFSTQVDWLGATFGSDVANIVGTAIIADNRMAIKYARPAVNMAQWAARHDPPYVPDVQDASRLFWSALNANGVDVTVDNGRATDRHAGTWFARFGMRLVNPANRPPIPAGLDSAWACESVFEWADVPGPVERYEAADASVQNLQTKTLQGLVGPVPTPLSIPEPILVGLDVAIDYRDMNRLILANPDYHIPQTYVDLLVSGKLITVHVRLIGADGSHGDFRTSSEIPSSHVGGARVASEASQQMRLLTEGRPTVMRPYAADVLAKMRAAGPSGHGLRLRLGKPAPKRRLGPSSTHSG